MKRMRTAWIIFAALGFLSSGCVIHKAHNLPPAERLFERGPGVAGPGPGVLPPATPPAAAGGAEVVPPYASVAGLPRGGKLGLHRHRHMVGGVVEPVVAHGPQQNVQILFSEANQMEGLQIRWDVGGVGQFDSEPLIVPGRQNFPQGGIYRLKLTNIPGRVGLELYPSIEVGPTTPRTEAYLAHNAIPIQFTNEDFDQVESNNFVTKVIYLPDPEFQELALAKIETLVSTRLDPGVDPIVEADRRGSIMAIIRMGNKDIEMPGSQAGAFTPTIPASYQPPVGSVGPIGPGGGPAPFGPQGGPVPFGPQGGPTPFGPANIGFAGTLPNYVSGVTSPTWGMPWTGTPIGLPGPAHIPMGGPASLHTHTMRNHTHMHLPKPVGKFKIDVKQNPGYSYPHPVSRVRVFEQNIHAPQMYRQPHWNMHQVVK